MITSFGFVKLDNELMIFVHVMMFSKANLQTFRFIHQRTSTEFAEKKNAVEQKILDKKIKVFEKGQKHIHDELVSIKKEKYSRNFYSSSPLVKEERLKHSRFVEVVVSTSKEVVNTDNKSSGQRNQLYNNGKQKRNDNSRSTNRKSLLTASSVGRTITSMRKASNVLDYSMTPGQVVRVSCPAELEEKVKRREPARLSVSPPGAKYLSRRRHSVAIGAGIACNREQPGVSIPDDAFDDACRKASFLRTRCKNIRRKSLPTVEIESCSEEDGTGLHKNDTSSTGTSSAFDPTCSWPDTRYLFPGKGEPFSRLSLKARRPLSAKSNESSRNSSSSSDIFDDDEDFYGYCEEYETPNQPKKPIRKNAIPFTPDKLLKRMESSPPCLKINSSFKPTEKKTTRSKSISTLDFTSGPRTPTQQIVSANRVIQHNQEETKENLSSSCSDLSDISPERDLDNTSKLDNDGKNVRPTKAIPVPKEKRLFKRMESGPPGLASSKSESTKKTRSKSIPTLHFPSASTQLAPESHEELDDKLSVICSDFGSDLSDISSKRDLDSTDSPELRNNRKEFQGIRRKIGLNNATEESEFVCPGSSSGRSCGSNSETGSQTPQSPRLSKRGPQKVGSGQRMRIKTSVFDLSENEKIVLRQTMLKRLEIQDGVAKAQRLSQQPFGDSKYKTKNSQLPRAASARTSGIKATDLSNKSNRRWTKFMRTNSQALGNMYHNISVVTKCRYLRCDSEDN